METMKQKLSDILTVISWREVARQYFGKTSKWIYSKMDGLDGNGCPIDFTDSERAMMKDALLDLSERLRRASEAV